MNLKDADSTINILDVLTEPNGKLRWLLGGDTTIYRLVYLGKIDYITKILISNKIPYSITDSYIDDYKRVNVLISEVINYRIRLRDDKINSILDGE